MCMDEKHLNLVKSVVADIQSVYNKHLTNVSNDEEYYAVMSAIIIAKHLEMEDLELSLLSLEPNPKDVVAFLEEKAIQIADSIVTPSNQMFN